MNFIYQMMDMDLMELFFGLGKFNGIRYIIFKCLLKALFKGRTSCAPLNYGACGCAYQHMLVNVRIEIHEELLRGSSHEEEPYHTASPAAERLSRVVLWGPVRTASRMYTIYESQVRLP